MGYPPYGYDPNQQSGGYPPQQPASYPPQQPSGGYPPQQPGAYPPPDYGQQSGGYTAPPPAYPSQPLYPPGQPAYPSQGLYYAPPSMPYGAPYGAPIPVGKPGNPAFAITGFVLSIIGFLVALFSILLGGPLTIIALVFSALALRIPRLRGLAIAGLVIAILSLLLDIVTVFFNFSR